MLWLRLKVKHSLMSRTTMTWIYQTIKTISYNHDQGIEEEYAFNDAETKVSTHAPPEYIMILILHHYISGHDLQHVLE